MIKINHWTSYFPSHGSEVLQQSAHFMHRQKGHRSMRAKFATKHFFCDTQHVGGQLFFLNRFFDGSLHTRKGPGCPGFLSVWPRIPPSAALKGLVKNIPSSSSWNDRRHLRAQKKRRTGAVPKLLFEKKNTVKGGEKRQG